MNPVPLGRHWGQWPYLAFSASAWSLRARAMSCLVWDSTRSTLGSLAAMAWISFILRSTVAESVGSQRARTASLTSWMVAASVSGSGRQPTNHQTTRLLQYPQPLQAGEHPWRMSAIALLLDKPRHLSLVVVVVMLLLVLVLVLVGCFRDAIGFLSCVPPRGGGMWAQLWQLSVWCHRKLWAWRGRWCQAAGTEQCQQHIHNQLQIGREWPGIGAASLAIRPLPCPLFRPKYSFSQRQERITVFFPETGPSQIGRF